METRSESFVNKEQFALLCDYIQERNSLSSAITRSLHQTLDPLSAQAQQKQDKQQRKIIVQHLSESSFVNTLWLSFEALEHTTKSDNFWQIPVLGCHIIDRHKTISLFQSLTREDLKDPRVTTSISYIVDALYWQVMNIYTLEWKYLDDEFLNLMVAVKDIVQSCERLGLEAWQLEDICHYAAEHCLKEYRALVHAWWYPTSRSLSLAPWFLGRQGSFEESHTKRNELITLLEQATKNPQAQGLISRVINYRTQQLQTIDDDYSWPDNLSQAEQYKRQQLCTDTQERLKALENKTAIK